jgi:hypothetical protein
MGFQRGSQVSTFRQQTRQLLKVLHFVVLALWLGGLAAWFPLLALSDRSDLGTAISIYTHMREIAWNVIRWGGIGSFVSGIALALVGPWRIRVERWIWLKAALTIGAILFGIFVIEARMLSNLALLQAEGERALRSSIFLIQQSEIQLTAYLQLSLFTAIIAIAVFKPLRKRSPHPHPQR